MSDYKIEQIFNDNDFEYEVDQSDRAAEIAQKIFEQWAKDKCVKVGGFGSQWCTSANKYDTHLSLLLPPQEIKNLGEPQ